MKYAIAILALAAAAFAQSGSPCPVTLNKAHVGVGNNEAMLHFDVVNDSTKPIKAIKYEMVLLDATHDPIYDIPVVIGFPIKPSKRLNSMINLDDWIARTGFDSMRLTPIKVVFKDGSEWEGSCASVQQ